MRLEWPSHPDECMASLAGLELVTCFTAEPRYDREFLKRDRAGLCHRNVETADRSRQANDYDLIAKSELFLQTNGRWSATLAVEKDLSFDRCGIKCPMFSIRPERIRFWHSPISPLPLSIYLVYSPSTYLDSTTTEKIVSPFGVGGIATTVRKGAFLETRENGSDGSED